MRLGATTDRPQAQLDGFKSRALRMEVPTAQRHLYTTEWRALELKHSGDVSMLMVTDEDVQSAQCERLSSRVERGELASKMHGCTRTAVAVAVATQRGPLSSVPLFALEVALGLVQTQAGIASPPGVWLLTTAMRSPCQPEHGGLWGLEALWGLRVGPCLKASQPSPGKGTLGTLRPYKAL